MNSNINLTHNNDEKNKVFKRQLSCFRILKLRDLNLIEVAYSLMVMT